jgi:non-heme chloroperoxidase
MTTRSLALITASLVSLPAFAADAQRSAHPAADTWHDTAPHTTKFVTVAPNVKLHYLDFGGGGEPIVLLAGLGNTAHAFDDFAPRLTDKFRVIAITRRGFGESSHPGGGYETPRLVEDIRQALDKLHLTRVILIGHSIAGEEMTRFASTYPDRVLKLVYLDAAYDRVAGSAMLSELFPVQPAVPNPPIPTAADTASAAAYVAYVHRTRGVNIPEADIRVRYKYDGWNEDITPASMAIAVETPNHKGVRAPALAIYAVTDSVSQMEPWQARDREHAAALAEMISVTESVMKKLRAQFRQEVAGAKVVEVHGGHHWVFVSHRDVVLRAIRDFLLS